MAIAEFLSDIIIFLYAFFACAVVASRRRARRWSSPPAPRRARAPAASTPHAHDAASFRSFAAPARTDDRRTNDATSGPQEWLTGTLHEGGIRSVRSPLRRAPLLATPIATPLQCGRPKRPGLLFNFSLGDRASGSLRATTGPMPWSRQWPAPSTAPQQEVPASLGGRTRFHGGLAISQARATHVEDNW